MNWKNLPRTVVAKALERQVSRLIKSQHPVIVAITGSVGKTSTKLAIAHVLSSKYQVLAHPGNYNSEIGLPLSVFELEAPKPLINPLAWMKILSQVKARRQAYKYDALVLEMGADQPRDIQKFMHYIHPDIAVLTRIAPAHIEQFKTIEAILEEKWHLARGSQKVIINGEDKRLADKAKELNSSQLTTYGIDSGDYHFSSLKLHENGYEAQLHLGKHRLSVKTHVIAKHLLGSLLAAAAVADKLKVEQTDILERLESWAPANGRMNPVKGKHESLIIDDTYNSSPEATFAALDALYQFRGRKIAILGSMNELGDFERQGHEQVGRHCSRLDLLVTIGRAANQHLAPVAIESGLKPTQVHNFDSPYAAGEFVLKHLKAGDRVLAKGSQNGVFAEEAVKLLLADPADASKLVRQSPEWLAKKQKQFPQIQAKHVKVSINLPHRLLKNNIDLSQKHLEEIKSATVIERQWYEQAKPFKTLAEILAAAKTGRLQKIEPSPNYLPILRFRNPKLAGIYPPYLKAGTKVLLEEVTSRWRKETAIQGVGPDARLAVTALIMTEAYRDELIKAGKLAIDKGPHVLGEAFDIDGCGYYLGESPVNPRRQTHAEWDAVFGQMGAQLARPDFQNYDQYNPKVHQALQKVLEDMMKEGKLHYVLEYPGTTNASYHICRHPDYHPSA
jgi:UDP-N-acetylmuramoyl-tripeptide--D-alanyl-D-alanine ligase